MKTKKCHKCDTEKEIKEFGKDKTKSTGVRSTCKECGKKYDSERRKTRKRKSYMKAFHSYYAKSGMATKVDRKYRKKYPRKHKAHKLVRVAIKNGSVTKQPCEICGELNTHAHHDNYNKPLEVRWLCCKHHNDWHKENGEGLNGS